MNINFVYNKSFFKRYEGIIILGTKGVENG